MHSKENWDDLRYVLAVAGAGSVAAAARDLGVNHATVLRRVAAFEARAGVEIFNKSATGYAVQDDRLQVIAAVREVETAVLGVRRMIDGTQAPFRGQVRVTSTDTFCHVVLPPIVRRLQDHAKELQIELLSSNAHLDFTRLQADIAVRPAVVLADELYGEVAAMLGFDVYAAPGSAQNRWLAMGSALSRTQVAKWMIENIPAEAICASSDSFLTLRELAAAGLGQAILPCVLADSDPRLERRRGILPDVQVEIWVASHADLADVPRIRGVRRMLVEELSGDADRLAGRL
jgi:DNA-binding transcriptional LysR family regulator